MRKESHIERATTTGWLGVPCHTARVIGDRQVEELFGWPRREEVPAARTIPEITPSIDRRAVRRTARSLCPALRARAGCR